MPRRKFAFHYVEIRPADSAGADLEKNLAGFRLRLRDLDDLERTFGDRAGSS
jgi:hypothetical protein